MTRQTDVDVLIVGAGPVGLTLACLLARYGVKFRLIDKNKALTQSSEVLKFKARSLELFEQLHLTDEILAAGRPATDGEFDGEAFLQTFGKGLTKYPIAHILEKSKTEQLLIEKLGSLKQGVHWQWELLAIRQHREHVDATIVHFERIEKITAKYVVGAGGAQSILRQQLQIASSEEKTHHRCLLTGDSFGTGFQDAFNLGWKLHMVLSGSATEQLLKTYNEERAPITKKTPPNFANSLMGLASLFRPVQKRIFSSISEIGISYEGSSLSLGKHAGRRIEMREADGYFHAYMIADPETQKEAALILRRFLGKNVKVHTLSSYPNIQNFLAKYGLHKDGILLIRPDQYIAYVGEGLKTSELSQYLGRHFKLKINDHGKAWNAAFDDEQLSL